MYICIYVISSSTFSNIRIPEMSRKFPGHFQEKSGKFPGNFRLSRRATLKNHLARPTAPPSHRQ